jgi:hypothetical protein
MRQKTSIIGWFVAAGLLLAVGICRADKLYASNQGNNTIEEFTSGGVGSVFASTGLNQPVYIAFTNDAGVPLPLANQAAVPLPGVAWGMPLLLAVALTGRFRRRV